MNYKHIAYLLAKSSIFIGLLRFHLMLPASPLDPSEEVLYKIQTNNDRIEAIKREITVIIASKKVGPDRVPNSRLAKNYEGLDLNYKSSIALECCESQAAKVGNFIKPSNP